MCWRVFALDVGLGDEGYLRGGAKSTLALHQHSKRPSGRAYVRPSFPLVESANALFPANRARTPRGGSWTRLATRSGSAVTW